MKIPTYWVTVASYLNSAIIEFDNKTELGDKIDGLTIENYNLYGILPLTKLGDNLFECGIDRVEKDGIGQ